MSAKFPEKILVVDDEPNLLNAIKRQLRGRFNITTAEGGQQGLKVLKDESPFAIVISDMRMPEMNGIQFLREVTKKSPDSVRMMLTGNADIETAVHAVNDGNIFRFLTKPCKKEILEWAFESGIKQYRLVRAERDLLENTLRGSIRVLTTILELVNPLAFSRTSRVRKYVKQIVKHLNIKAAWQFDLAAMLCQIGCVTVPSDVLAKVYAGTGVTDEEQAMYAQHPSIAEQLLSRIPRLERVSQMIAAQHTSFAELNIDSEHLPKDSGVLGGLILKTVIDLDTLISQGHSKSQAVGELRLHSDDYHPLIFDALSKVEAVEVEVQCRSVDIRQLNEAMILAEDIRTKDGRLLAAKGQQAGLSVRTLLVNYLERKEIDEMVRVDVPTNDPSRQTAGASLAAT